MFQYLRKFIPTFLDTLSASQHSLIPYSTERVLIIAYRDSVPRPLCSSLFLRSRAGVSATRSLSAVAESFPTSLQDSVASPQALPASVAPGTLSSTASACNRSPLAPEPPAPASCHCESTAPPLGA